MVESAGTPVYCLAETERGRVAAANLADNVQMTATAKTAVGWFIEIIENTIDGTAPDELELQLKLCSRAPTFHNIDALNDMVNEQLAAQHREWRHEFWVGYIE
jgi:hypothetical protein